MDTRLTHPLRKRNHHLSPNNSIRNNIPFRTLNYYSIYDVKTFMINYKPSVSSQATTTYLSYRSDGCQQNFLKIALVNILRDILTISIIHVKNVKYSMETQF